MVIFMKHMQQFILPVGGLGTRLYSRRKKKKKERYLSENDLLIFFLFLFYFIFFFATLLSTTIVWSVFQRKKKPTELPLARDVLSQEWSQVSLEKLKASLLFYIICVVTKAIVDEDHTQTIADCTKSREICPFLLLQKKKKNQNFFHCTTEKTSVANPCRFRILTSSSRLVLRKKNLPQCPFCTLNIPNGGMQMCQTPAGADVR